MENKKLCEKIETLITELFGDKSVSLQTTLANMRAIIDQAQTFAEAIEIDIQILESE
jgi:hypothetical protein